MKIAVVGFGNELRGDDAIGLLITRKLSKKIKSKKVKFFEIYSALELLDLFRKFDKLIIIDAAEIGKKPGSVLKRKEIEIEASDKFTHSLNLKLALKLAKQLGKKPEIVFYLIQPKKLFGKMSREVKKSIEKVAKAIEKELLLNF